MNAKVMLAAVAFTTIGAGAAFASSSVRQDHHKVTEFALGRGQSKTIAGEKMADYRICFEHLKSNLASVDSIVPPLPTPDVELRVVADGTSSTITPGNCADLQAKSIVISPAKMGFDQLLAGRIEHLG
jgi:hypothetical protein